MGNGFAAGISAHCNRVRLRACRCAAAALPARVRSGAAPWLRAPGGRFVALAAAFALALWPVQGLRAQGEPATTEYRVTFQGTWTTAATPGGLPGGAHFSPLIGASHNDSVTFWEAGASASAGVESVAEVGGTSRIRNEFNASGHVLAIFQQGLGNGGTPSANVNFQVSAEHSLVTLLTMIAPSPDWFVGISGLSLLDGADQWRARVEVDLYPYDAGTENGSGFSLSNPDTVPRGVITSIRGTGKFSNAPMARVTFDCVSGCTPPTDPSPTDPPPTDPPPTDPMPTDPMPTDPMPTDPMPTDPPPTDPPPTDPPPTDPPPTDPMPTDPVPPDPVPPDPVPPDPVTPDPVTPDPPPTDPPRPLEPDPEPALRNVPLFPSATDADGRQGFVRVINRSAESAEVEVVAIDDRGKRSDALVLSVAGGATAHFVSIDLETGNDEKGLSGGTGALAGDLRLELAADLDFEVLSYVRGRNGLLTAMHDLAPGDGNLARVAMFNPGRNRNQRSLLRLINPGTAEAAVMIGGFDDAGNASGTVRVRLPAGGAATFPAAFLESAENRAAAPATAIPATVEGELGTGEGKWRLTIRSGQPLMVMNLMESLTGNLTNLSTAPHPRGAAE